MSSVRVRYPALRDLRRPNQGAHRLRYTEALLVRINPLGYSQRKLCLTPLQTVRMLGLNAPQQALG